MENVNSEKLTFMRQQNNLSGTQTGLRKNTANTNKLFGNYYIFQVKNMLKTTNHPL